jgi:hypothetical protein
MKALMQRSDARAIRDTLLWYLLIIGAGLLAWLSLKTVWAVPAFALYGALYLRARRRSLARMRSRHSV